MHAAVETFLASCAKGNAEAAELALNEPAKKLMLEAGSPREGCVLILGVPVKDLPPKEGLGLEMPDERVLKEILEKVAIGRVIADGGFASVELDTPVGPATAELERVRGKWHISSGPAPPPPPPLEPPPPPTIPDEPPPATLPEEPPPDLPGETVPE